MQALGRRHRRRAPRPSRATAGAVDERGVQPGRHGGWPRPAGPDGRGSGTRHGQAACAPSSGHTGRVAERGLQPGRHAPGLGRRGQDGAGSGTPPPARSSSPSHGHAAASAAWRSARTGSAWPRPAADRDGAGLGRGHRAGACAPSRATPARCCSVAFSPDGRRLAAASWDGRCRSGTPHDRPGAPRPRRAHAAGSGAWRSARTATRWPRPAGTGRSGSGTRRPGQELLALTGHTGGVMSVAFSPDGQRLASAQRGPDGAGLGRRHAARSCSPSRATPARSMSVAFSPDGTRLASASGTGRSASGTPPPAGAAHPHGHPGGLRASRSARTGAPGHG